MNFSERTSRDAESAIAEGKAAVDKIEREHVAAANAWRSDCDAAEFARVEELREAIREDLAGAFRLAAGWAAANDSQAAANTRARCNGLALARAAVDRLDVMKLADAAPTEFAVRHAESILTEHVQTAMQSVISAWADRQRNAQIELADRVCWQLRVLVEPVIASVSLELANLASESGDRRTVRRVAAALAHTLSVGIFGGDYEASSHPESHRLAALLCEYVDRRAAA